MIRIKKIFEENSVRPERDLAPEELETVIMRYGDDSDFIYYQVGEENNEDYIRLKTPSLYELKESVKANIDLRTQELIFAGFLFAGLIFSMSVEAQINWSNFPVLYQSAPQLFPLDILSKNDELYSLKYSDIMSFYFSAVSHKNTQLQSGNILKQQVNAMTTAEELNNFVDPR